jgi:hypothetical protein
MSTSMDFDGFWGMVPFDEICTFIVPFVTTESEALKPRWLSCGGMQQAGRSFFFWWADLVELVQHSLMLAFSCFCSGWHFLCAPSELLALNGCLTFQTQCIARCLALAGVAGPPKAHVLNASQLRMAQHTVQYHFSIMCFVNFRHVSAHFIAFTWCKAATIQGTVLQFAGMPAKQSVSFWQLQGWNYWKGIIPRTWRLQTGLGGHNLDCGNI